MKKMSKTSQNLKQICNKFYQKNVYKKVWLKMWIAGW